jgi:hypothetical protein
MKNKSLPIFIVMCLLAAGFIVSIFSLRGALKERGRARADVKALEGDIDRLKQDRISLGQIDFLKEKSARLKADYETHMLPVLNSPALHYPQDKLDFYQCRQRISDEETSCRNECKDRVQLPDSLGLDEYKESIFAESEIPNLLKKIELLDEVKRLALDSEITNLLRIGFPPIGGITTFSGDPGMSYRDFPVNIVVEGEIASVVKLLYNIRKSRFAFLVKDFKVVPVESAKMEGINVKNRLPVENGVVADILLSTVVLTEPPKEKS